MNSRLRSLCSLLALTLAGLFATSCTNIHSTPLSPGYNSREGTDRSKAGFQNPQGKPASGKPRGGEHPVTRYYLPVPYVTVRAYEVRVLGQTRLHFTTHATALPDIGHPLLLDHDVSMAVRTALRVTTSREGFLERITYGREPQTAQAVAAMAKAALSVVAPIPLPFKGDVDFPEFSRLVFERNYQVDNFSTNKETIAGRSFDITLTAGVVTNLTADQLSLSYGASPGSSPSDKVALKSIPGFYYRPLIPVKVAINQTTLPSGSAATDLNITASGNNQLVNIRQKDAQGNVVAPLPKDLLFTIRGTVSANADPNARLELTETPVHLESIVYCADPRQVDAYFFTQTFLASQDLDFKFSAGNLYEVRAKRESDLKAVAEIPLEILASPFGAIGGLFKVDVQHHGAEPGSATGYSDDKGTPRTRPPIEKE